MLHATLVFIAASLIMLTLSRLGLALWQYKRVEAGGGLAPILFGGLRIDLHQIGIIVALPAVLGPWLGHFPAATEITFAWYWFGWVLLILMEVSTPPFISEYDSRPNRLFVEYLKHPREVSGMIWRGHRLSLVGGLSLLVLLGGVLPWLAMSPEPDAPMTWWLRPIASLVILAVVILAIRGTLGHRPMNASTVAYASDAMLNTLPLNSLYSVSAAIYNMRREKSASALYGDMPLDEQHALLRKGAGLQGAPMDDAHPTRHAHTASTRRDKPLNLVIIIEESLGAQYSASLGGQNLTPHLDALSEQAWTFTRTYATGTRSVRGLEAILTGFPPTPAQAVVKLPRAQQGFFSIADLLGRQGYTSRFIYGGEAHFDNMKGFFLGNGFDRIIDRSDFEKPAFVGTWGACDEDMFDEVDRVLRADSDQPSLTVAFSVSNHTPWEYPAGRIAVEGAAATAENSVRYADWALGAFFEKAKKAPYWDNTVFLVVADHDSRVFGASLVPVRHFHIPAIILGADVKPKRDDRLISQIDLAPTLLSLIGVDSTHPMIGHDLTQSSPGRAMMQYGENYGYLKDSRLLVLTPHARPTQYDYLAPETFNEVPLDAGLVREALAHAIWPSWAYMECRYTLGAKSTTPA